MPVSQPSTRLPIKPDSDFVPVMIKQGQLYGKKELDCRGRSYCSFQGIPYAKPPINELRFRAPLPPDPWTGQKSALEEGSDCYHNDTVHNRKGGSDDCLFVNVYTPQLEPRHPMPVMVWIHGAGMFKCGSGHSDYYGPKYLMPQDVVLVTFNYRLGITGFLNLADETLGVTGNAGLKDMVMALRWVNRNIKDFGGDPDNVTIAGQGAGAASVHLLMLSKMAKGLFHKAIAQSGSALCPWVWSENVEWQGMMSAKVTTKLCKILGISRANEKGLLAKLQAMDCRELHEIEEKIPEVAEMATIRNFGPIIEKNLPGAFLCQKPINIILSGDYNRVPLIMGFNSLDGAVADRWMNDNKTIEKTTLLVTENGQWDKNQWRMVIPHALHNLFDTQPLTKIKKLGRLIMSCYFGRSIKQSLYSFYTDNMFARDVTFAAEFHAKTSPCPVYLYEMFIDTNLNVMKQKTGLKFPGTSYEDDLYYLFSTKETENLLAPGSPEAEAVAKITGIWTDFMKHADPNAGVTNRSWYWTPISGSEMSYLQIKGDRSTGIQLVSGFKPENERLQFWRIAYQLDPDYVEFFARGLNTAKHLAKKTKTENGGDDADMEASGEVEFKDGDDRFEKVFEQLKEFRNNRLSALNIPNYEDEKVENKVI